MKYKKYRKPLVIVAFIVLCILLVYFSVKCNITGFIVSTLGSMASLYAIIEALIRMKTIEEQNSEIKSVVETKISQINKQEASEQVNKYIEVIARILSYIECRNAEAAILKIEELQIFLHNVQCNPTTIDGTRKVFRKHQRTVKEDVLVLRDKNQLEPFPKDVDCKVLTKHFEELRDSLIQYSQQIHFEK